MHRVASWLALLGWLLPLACNQATSDLKSDTDAGKSAAVEPTSASSRPASDAHRPSAPSASSAGFADTAAVGTTEPTPGSDNSVSASLAIFRQRILPIFQSPNPSSCTECHLSGVELKDYIRPTQQETFSALVAGGLVDIKQPDESKILEFISRQPETPNLVTDTARQRELEAFRAWIRAAVSDPQLVAAKADSAVAGPQLSVEVIRHARRDRVLASFVDNVWAEVGRCAGCHSPDMNQKQVRQHGEQMSWITLRDPPATMQYLIDAALIDVDAPERSLILAKPTLQVPHGGGQKMLVGDRAYKQFRRFIDDYAAIVHGKYRSGNDLPQPSDEVAITTEIWLKITGVPEKYDGMLMQIDLYRWTGSGWSEHRTASSDRAVFGKGKLWQHSLSLTAPRGSQWAGEVGKQRLPPGRYLVKIYIDQKKKLEDDFRIQLGGDDFVGQIEVDSRWPLGYGSMTAARFPEE